MPTMNVTEPALLDTIALQRKVIEEAMQHLNEEQAEMWNLLEDAYKNTRWPVRSLCQIAGVTIGAFYRQPWARKGAAHRPPGTPAR